MSLAPGVQRSAAADLLQASRSLAVLGEVLADEIGAAFLELLAAFAENHGHQVAQHRARLFHLLATEAELYPEPLTGDAWQNHLLDCLLGEESPFSLKAQRAPFAQLGPSLVSQTRQ